VNANKDKTDWRLKLGNFDKESRIGKEMTAIKLV
jgi:hypothetical protein